MTRSFGSCAVCAFGLVRNRTRLVVRCRGRTVASHPWAMPRYRPSPATARTRNEHRTVGSGLVPDGGKLGRVTTGPVLDNAGNLLISESWCASWSWPNRPEPVSSTGLSVPAFYKRHRSCSARRVPHQEKPVRGLAREDHTLGRDTWGHPHAPDADCFTSDRFFQALAARLPLGLCLGPRPWCPAGRAARRVTTGRCLR
jgi:hypothetical protein